MSEILKKLQNLSESDVTSVVESHRRGVPTTAFGVPFGLKCAITSLLDGRILYIVKDFLEAEKTAEEIRGLCDKSVAVLYEREEVLLQLKAHSKTTLYKRIKGVVDAKTADVIIAPVQAVLGLYPNNLSSLKIERGQIISVNELEKQLVARGYKKTDLVDGAGTFARRGDIFDIFAVGQEYPARLDFFDDEIERIKIFDDGNLSTISTPLELVVLPAEETSFTDEEELKIKEKIKEEQLSFKGKNNVKFKEFCEETLDELERKNYSALAVLAPFFDSFKPIYDVFDFDSVIFSEPKQLYEVLFAVYKEHAERFTALYENGEVFGAQINQLIEPEKLISSLTNKRLLAFQALTADVKFFNPLKMITLKSTPSSLYVGKFKELIGDVFSWVQNGYTVELFTADRERGEKLKEQLLAEGFSEENGVYINDKKVKEGFIAHSEKCVLLGSDNIYLKPKVKQSVSRKKTKAFFSAPVAGDYAVHEIHGIGKVIGNKKLTTGLGTKDYVAIAYKGGDILYVPVEQLDAISRYVGGEKEPQLSKIGGKDFERIKSRVRESLRQLSFDLKKLYSERASKKGFVFECDEESEILFESSFGHEDTYDQQTTNEEIRIDMCSPKVMDRLVCGDVGYGKTEVALRAVFRAILNGKQAVMLAPTTILAEQHFNTAKERFKDFAVTVESLDRFKTKKQQTEVLQKLKEGKIDFIVGTHRLLSSDVAFKDLGLLVLDEEQRFGVEHKEKIKLLKNNVDTLTLTATPIPRTLHMSLSGIRDISTIKTAPKERLPVQTYVTEETDTLIADACRREIVRGGQVFILYNRVETIYHFAEKIKTLLPDAKITVAHGQLEERVLEKNIAEFYRGESDILLATTIIENGIDLPKANTIIVIDADKLGLSTLYQLRGRVGRSNRLAHAYFTFKREKVLSDIAYKRLTTLMEFTEMGSGFKIAMRDLEIRGAGDILGAKQHGHLDKVGYELYSKLLQEEIEGKKEQELLELDVKIGAYIPDEYIENASGRMDAYKEIAGLEDEEEAKDVLHSLKETYGPVPTETMRLIKIALIKRRLTLLGAKSFYLGKDSAFFGFKTVKALENNALLDEISLTKGCSIAVSEGIGVKFERGGLDADKTLNMLVRFLGNVLKKGKDLL